MGVSALARPAPGNGLRVMQPSRDLREIANLVEDVFADEMDERGHRAMQEIRALAKMASIFRNFPGWEEAIFRGLSGVVWEENGRIVGNATVQSYDPSSGLWQISNVAVAREFRGRGIGRKLMEGSLDTIRRFGGRKAALQVRASNDVAIRLYESLGFREVFRETWWLGNDAHPAQVPMHGVVRPLSPDEEPSALALLSASGGEVVSRFAPIHSGDLAPTFEQRLWESLISAILGKRVWRLGLWEGKRLTGWMLVKKSSQRASITCQAIASPGAGRAASLISHGLKLVKSSRWVEIHVWGSEPEVMEFLERIGLKERLTLITMVTDLQAG